MAKRKLKRSGSPAFDFVAPLPIEECSYRIGHLQELRDLAYVPTIRIKKRIVDKDTTHFSIREEGPGALHIHGYLKRVNDRSTLVYGVVRSHPVIYIELGIALGILFVLTPVMGWLVGGLFLFLLGLFARRYWYGSQEEQARLIALTVDTLVY